MMLMLYTCLYFLYLILLAGVSIASAIACLLTILSGQFVSTAAFGYLSIACGLATIFSHRGFYTHRLARQKNAKLRHLHKEAPWHWRTDWNENQSHMNESVSPRAAWCYASIINCTAVSTVLYTHAFLQSSRTLLTDPPVNPIIVLTAFSITFVSGALYLTFNALSNSLLSRKTGSARLALNQVPVRPGEDLVGVIKVSRKLPTDPGFMLTLRSSTFRRASGYRMSRISLGSYRVNWEDTRTIFTDLSADDPRVSSIPVLFSIPEEATADNRGTLSDTEIRWTLTLTWQQYGSRYSASFGIPVFDTDEEPVIVREYSFSPTLFQTYTHGSREELHRHRIDISDYPDGSREYRFPAARNVKKIFLQGVVVAALWGGFTANLFLERNATTVLLWIVLGGGLLLNGVILTKILTRRITTLVSKMRISITEKEILRPAKHVEIPAADILSIHATHGWETGIYDIVVSPRHGKATLAAHAVPTMGLARWLVQDMRERLNRADIVTPEFQTLLGAMKR